MTSTKARVRITGGVGPAVAFVMAFGVGSPAFAQDREADAERLFREGQKLLEERRFGEACPKFEAAYKKDGQLGTLINLAFCHKEQGATWYAWLEFRDAEVKAAGLGRNDRKEFAHRNVVELEKQLPKVIVDDPRKQALTDVLVEERRVPEAESGVTFAAEAGQRKFTFRAKGKKPATVLIDIARGDRPQHVTAPLLEEKAPDEVPPETTPAATDAKAAPPPSPAPAAHIDGESGSTQRTLGFIALGVGSAGLVAGAITGVVTLSSPCAGTSADCTADKKDSADSTAMISNIAFGVAGAGLVGGLVLLMTAPKSGAASSAARPAEGLVVSPRVGAGWAGLSGTF